MPAMPPKAEIIQRISGSATNVIQAPKLEPRIMRYELSDDEWTAIKPMLPNKPRGVARPASMAQRRRCEGVLDMAPTILILTRS